MSKETKKDGLFNLGEGWTKTLLFITIGVVLGLGFLVAHAGRALSYLSDEPETCVNCHVMNTQYSTWQHSSHGRDTTCNDCHVPHDNFINHYFFKAKDGMNHATKFALRMEPQVIHMTEEAVGVVQSNCQRCHAGQVQHVSLKENDFEERQCWDCHREVPHGTVRSLSATPTQMRPRLPHMGIGNKGMTIGKRLARDKEEN